MNGTVFAAIFLFIPFIGTALGALAVFFVGKTPGEGLKRFLLGFASGVMLASSVWSLIIPSMEMALEQGMTLHWVPAVLGFALGMIFLCFSDVAARRLEDTESSPQGKSSVRRLFFVVTLHNIPEGMAVGVAISAAISEGHPASYAAAAALTLGIAVQNFPEGAIVSMPFAAAGSTRTKAFFLALLSGAVEPVFAFVTLLITSLVYPVLPAFLSFAAGAMVYVVAQELIPEANEGEKTVSAAMGVMLGFCFMMLLDICLG